MAMSNIAEDGEAGFQALAINEILNGEMNGEPEEKPPFEFLELSENNIKYTNTNFLEVKVKYNDARGCDVDLKVDGKTFKGHKRVLKEGSEYFSAMFSHDMKDKKKKEIEIKEISATGFTAMLDYFYYGVVTIDPKVVSDILEAARFFHIDWVTDVCCDFLMRYMYLVDYSLTMQLADKFSLGELRWEIFRHFGNNLPFLVDKENFLKELSSELFLQFLMEGMFVEVSEFSLMELIIKWVHADMGTRKEHFLPLLRQLRLPTMDLEELEAIPREVMEFQEIREEVEEAKSFCFDIASQCLKKGEKFQPRGARPTVIVAAFNDELNHNVVVYKDPEIAESNLFIENLSESRLGTDYSSSSQGTIGNFLFSVGGYGLDNYWSSNRMFRYEPKVREWEEVASMNQPRVSFAICSSEKRMYVFGGIFHKLGDLEDPEKILSSGEMYNPEENAWKRMYVCGGVFHKLGDLVDPEKILSSAEMYNPEENAWKNLASLPQGCYDLAAAVYNNTLYVCGGVSDSESKPVPLGESFCLIEGGDAWSSLSPMLTPRQGHSITPHDGKLIVIGGYTGSEFGGFKDCFENEVYDIETRQWTGITSTPENFGHIFSHVCFCGNKIYFLCNQDADAYLCTYDVETGSFGDALLVGPGFHKVGLLQIAYPHT